MRGDEALRTVEAAHAGHPLAQAGRQRVPPGDQLAAQGEEVVGAEAADGDGGRGRAGRRAQRLDHGAVGAAEQPDGIGVAERAGAHLPQGSSSVEARATIRQATVARR
nr:hypothetical protein GCM10020092_094970 [Actinoplanes digitatis]